VYFEGHWCFIVSSGIRSFISSFGIRRSKNVRSSMCFVKNGPHCMACPLAQCGRTLIATETLVDLFDERRFHPIKLFHDFVHLTHL
jgi:hypothetical protein